VPTPAPLWPDSQIAVFGGWNDSFDSDITLKQPNGTNMTLHDVPWDGVSSEAPPYWGIRGTWWLANNPNWGLMFDYIHAKVVADKGAVVSVSGRRDGTAIAPTDKVGNTFQVMEFTDGLNEFFFGAQYRWPHER
jgi:lipid A oxidase